MAGKANEVAAMVGKGVGLTNTLRGTPHHAKRGVVYFPQELLDEFRVASHQLPIHRVLIDRSRVRRSWLRRRRRRFGR